MFYRSQILSCAIPPHLLTSFPFPFPFPSPPSLAFSPRTYVSLSLRLYVEFTPPPLPAEIQYVRPFLSSTFRDFNDERNLSFKNAFPKIERMLVDRGLFFAPLDLRWGVTTEQSAGGGVVKICLEEIDRSRPYFVCSLGFRNGWAMSPTEDPDSENAKLLKKTYDTGIEAFPWIANHVDKSVTELEILHGMLNDPLQTPRSFVYFRSAAYLRTVPKAMRGVYAEMGWAEDKLMDLKRRVIKAGFQVKWFSTPQEWSDAIEADFTASIARDFPLRKSSPLAQEVRDHRTFGDSRKRCFVGTEKLQAQLDNYLLNGGAPMVVLADSGLGKTSLLANWVESVRKRQEVSAFPGRPYPQQQQQQQHGSANALTHTSSSSNAAASPNNTSNSSSSSNSNSNGPAQSTGLLELRRLRQAESHSKKQQQQQHDAELFVSHSNTSSALTSPSFSSSSSSTTSSSSSSSASSSSSSSVVLHFNTMRIQERYIGATSDSTLVTSLVLWVLAEIRDAFGLDGELPATQLQILQEFPDWLELASLSGPLLLVLDSLDQLAPDLDAHYLGWLPLNFPTAVRLVVSTVPGHPTADVLLRRGFNPLKIEPLLEKEAKALCAKYLGIFGKTLDNKQTDVILANPRTRNPLYLITFLQELRVFGSYEALRARIDYYMEAKDVTQLFLKVVAHLEEDFAEAPELVKWTLCLLATARAGLNERELKAALRRVLPGLAAVGTASTSSSSSSSSSSSPMMISSPSTLSNSSTSSFTSHTSSINSHNISAGAKSAGAGTRSLTSSTTSGAGSGVGSGSGSGLVSSTSSVGGLYSGGHNGNMDVLTTSFEFEDANLLFPSIDFAALMIRLEQSLIDQRGLKVFSHMYLKNAIAIKYFDNNSSTSSLRAECHRVLADVFHTMPPSVRKVQELPWHLRALCLMSARGVTPRYTTHQGLATLLQQTLDSLTKDKAQENSKDGTSSEREAKPGSSPAAAARGAASAVSSSSTSSPAQGMKPAGGGGLKLRMKKGGAAEAKSSSSASASEAALSNALLDAAKGTLPPAGSTPILGTASLSSFGVSSSSSLMSGSGSSGGSMPTEDYYELKDANMIASTDHMLACELVHVLTDFDLFQLLQTREHKFDLHKCWSLLERVDRLFVPRRAYYRALKEYERRMSDDCKFAWLCKDIGVFLMTTDRYPGANVFLEQALRILTNQLGPLHPDIEKVLRHKANLHFKLGEYEEARKVYSEALRVVEHNPTLIADRGPALRLAIADLCKERGLFAEALEMYQRSFEEQVQTQGKDTSVASIAMCNMAELQLRMEKPEAALPLFEKALQIMELQKGGRHPLVASILTSLGSTYDIMKDYVKARAMFERAIAIKEQTLGRDHIGTSIVINNLATSFFHEGMYDKALALYKRSLAIREKAYGTDHPHVAPTLANIAQMYLAMSEGEENNTNTLASALMYSKRAVAIMESTRSTSPLALADLLEDLAKCHVAAGMYLDAIATYERMIQIYTQHYGKIECAEIAHVLNAQAVIYSTHLHSPLKAIEVHISECAVTETVFGEKDSRVATVLFQLAAVYFEVDNDAEALQCLIRCYNIRHDALGPSDPDTQEAKQWLYDMVIGGDDDDAAAMPIDEFDPKTYDFSSVTLNMDDS